MKPYDQQQEALGKFGKYPEAAWLGSGREDRLHLRQR
jgi:hypothetical protein